MVVAGFLVISALRLVSLVAAGTAMAGAGLLYWFANRKSSAQREFERRQRINRIGRITDGTVQELREIPDNGNSHVQLVLYSYEIAGVSYECAQDVTWAAQRLDVHALRLGLPASVKYDPRNPGNSIVVAEDWIGLRHAK